MHVLSRLAGPSEAITEYASRHATSAHLADGFGEAPRTYCTSTGGMIGRHEAGFGQLLIVLSGTGWVSGDDGNRSQVNAGDVVYFERWRAARKGQ